MSSKIKAKLNEAAINRKARLNMFLMLSGKLVSLLGSSIYGFAIGLYVLKVTGSGMGFGVTLCFSLLPSVILAPFAGVISDRLERKKTVVIMDLLNGIVVLLLFFLAMTDHLRLGYIYATALCLSVFGTFFNVSLDSSVPNIVDDKRLMRLNSLNQTVSSLAGICGPMLGGLVFALVDIKIFLLVNGLSFIFSGIAELFMDFNLNVDPSRINANRPKLTAKIILTDLKEGLVFIKGQTILFMMLQYAVIINFLSNIGFGVPMPYLANNVIKFSAGQYGLITAASSIGILAGSLLLSVLPEIKKKYKLFFACLLISGATLILLGLPGFPAIQAMNKSVLFIGYFLVIFIIGVNNMIFNVPVMVMLQRETPDQYRGRVFGLFQTIVLSISPLSFIIAGAIIDKLPPYALPVGAGVLILLFVISVFSTNKELKTI